MPIADVRPRCALALAALCLLVAGPPAPGEAADGPRIAALRGVLAAPADTCGASHLDRRRLARFYPGRSPLPLWVDAKGPRPRARRLRAVLERSETEGLPSARYGLEAIAAAGRRARRPSWPASTCC